MIKILIFFFLTLYPKILYTNSKYFIITIYYYCLDVRFYRGFDRSNGRNSNGTGGGIRISDSDVTLKKLVLVGNEAAAGGAIGLLRSSPYIENVTIADNVSTLGGGVYIDNNSTPYIINSIIWNNEPVEEQQIVAEGAQNQGDRHGDQQQPGKSRTTG